MTTMSYPTKKEIGQRIKARREYRGISKLEMANLLGIGDRGYDHKEAARREITSTELAVIARALDVTTDYLLGEEEQQEMDQADRDTIRFIHNMPPDMQASARAAVRAMHDANSRLETTHGKKAE